MAIEKDLGAVSAYAIAAENGFQGTVEEWLESLIGPMGYQGWGISAVNVSADGSLIFTVKNPETGETRELEPIQIETLNALDSISTAKDEAVNEVKETQTQATEAVDTAGNQALQDISDAKTSATSAVNTAGTQAVDAVNTAGTQAASDAQTAIASAKNQAVSGVESAGQSAVGAVEEAQTSAEQAVDTAKNSAVQAVENAGTAEAEKISGILPVPTEADAGKVPVVKPDGSGYELGSQIDDGKTSLDTTWSSENIISQLCPPFEVSGSIVTCQPVVGSRLNVLTQIEPIQEGTGDPNPENVRPIRGWDAVNVWRGGRNLIGGDLVSKPSPIGRPTDSWGYITETLPTGEYVWQAQYSGTDTNAIYIYLNVLFEDGSISDAYYITTLGGEITNYATVSLGKPGKLFVYSAGVEGNTQEKSMENLQKINLIIEPKSNSTNYEPYRGETFTIPLGQTVYGGTLDISKGSVSISWVEINWENADLSLQSVNQYNIFNWIFYTDSLGTATADAGNILSSSLPIDSNAIASATSQGVYKANNIVIYIRLSEENGANKESAIAYLKSINEQIVYKLATPVTIQLTPQEIYALSGVNTIYADAGDITVSGHSDPNAIINSLADRIAALEHNAIGG